MSSEPTHARRRARALRRALLLCVALLALAPAAAQASRAIIVNSTSLWVLDAQHTSENTIVLDYDAQAKEYLIADDSGIDAFAGCSAAGQGVVCPDPNDQIREIYIVLQGGDDVFSVSEDTDPLPPQVLETIVGGGPGSDVVVGGPGRDRILGESGRDVLAGGGGDDKVVGGEQRDGLIGFGGDDLLLGGEGADALFGFGGDDILRGEVGSDTLLGGRGDDRLLGGPKVDLLEAGRGVDVLLGETGRDRLLALDRIRDRRIHCGPGPRERVERDPFDPPARSC
jgi:Ca2+-binding RTX toxin-like protein